jgi:predicted exporter
MRGLHNPRIGVFLLLGVAIVALAILHTDMRTDIRDFFFPGAAVDAGFRIGQQQAEQLSRRYIVSVTYAGDDESTARVLVDALQQALSGHAGVSRVWSGESYAASMTDQLLWYAPHVTQLYSLQPKLSIEEIFSDAHLQQRARMIRQALLGPDPQRIKALLLHDPLLLSIDVLAGHAMRDDSLSRESRAITFFVETHQSGLDTDTQAGFQYELERMFADLQAQQGAALGLEYTGVPVFSVAIRQQVAGDVQRIALLSMLAIALLSWLVLRSIRAVLLLAILLLVSVGFAVLLSQWVFGYVHGMTLALGTTLTGVCIDYFIHGMVHAGSGTLRQRQQALRRIWPALLTAATTTLVGYLALSLSGYPGLQQLAVFAVAGIAMALLLTRYFLTALVTVLGVRIKPSFDPGVLLQGGYRRRGRVLLAIVVCVVVVPGIGRVEWRDDMGLLSADMQQLRDNDSRIRARLSSVEPGRFVLVAGDTVEQALQRGEAVQRVLLQLQAAGKLESFSALYPWLASQQLQSDNAAAWNAALDDDVRTRWQQALTRAGLNAVLFPPLPASTQSLLLPDDLGETALWPLLSQQLLLETAQATTAIWLSQHDPAAVVTALQGLAGARYFSQKDSLDALSASYRVSALSMLAWGGVAILLMLMLRYRSILSAVRVLSPALLSVLLVLGLWGVSAVAPGILHLIGLLLATAICVDYGVFFFENAGGNLQRTLRAISISALTTAVSFACLGAADMPALHALAWTVAPAVLFGFLLCPLLLPGHNSGP